MAAGGDDDAVERGDIGIVAAGGDDDVFVSDDQRIGGIERQPAEIGAAPDAHPGMHGIGALAARVSRRRIGADEAADIGGRQAERPERRDHDVRVILAAAAAQRERLFRARRGIGGVAIIEDIAVQAVHQIDRAIADRRDRRKALRGVVANKIEHANHAAGIEEVRGRLRRQIA